MGVSAAASGNFSVLGRLDDSLATLGAQAELLFTLDPAACLMRLRLLGERLARELAAQAGLRLRPDEKQHDLIHDLRSRGLLHPEVAQLFHGLRMAGNRASHEGEGTSGEALHQLKMARRLGLAVLKTLDLVPHGFKPGAFVPPAPPQDASADLRAELEELRAEAAKDPAGRAEVQEVLEYARELSEDYERKLAALQAKLVATDAAFDELAAARDEEMVAIQATVAEKPAAEQQDALQHMVAQASDAGTHLDLTEAETRKLIDQQLRDAGWEADSRVMRHSRGTRPQKGRNTAIAEWPTASGPADYALFVGLQLIGIVEAKRSRRSVVSALGQSQRYARSVGFDNDVQPAGGPWSDYRVPFLFATNGRPYLKQIVEESGVWFLDARLPTNLPRALDGWHTPEGLSQLLAQDHQAAYQKLEADPVENLGLRYYQDAAIRAVERAIEKGQRELLLAMATGTGKTRTCIGLVYRLLKAGRFRRVLFVVDRSALGEQAEGAFKEVKVDQLKTFAEVFDLQGLESDGLETATRLHIATIQAMLRRTLFSDSPPPVDTYDCIVVDESHRGFTLDAEMSDMEMGFRSQRDYISKYRAVIEHFDAVKIGLTATPALHTREIFGDPVFSYSYPEAVVDGYLVDHEPPVRIVTALAQDGITWKAGEEVATYSPKTQSAQLWLLPDEVQIEVEGFNRKVVTENFNRVVARELVKHIDPEGLEKTLVFCANDRHADLFVRVLREAYVERLGDIDEAAIQKITGAADRPRELIRRYKNERKPTIAVTVDLLTTGIDVPSIANLVFLRRVGSRILYEQMLGRATRLCPEIGKEVFRIFDAVDLYAALDGVTDMKPVAAGRSTSFTQLVEELCASEDADTRDFVLGELMAKLHRKKRRLRGEAAEQFEHLAGDDMEAFLETLRHVSTKEAADIFRAKPDLGSFLDRKLGGEARILISDHEDELVEVSHGYGAGRTRPRDYLDAFAEFVRANMNEMPALVVVTQRPRELTRAQLKGLKLALDEAGFGEPSLRTAWRELSNVNIAASVVGYIRQAALGDALVPYDQRVDRALTTILSSKPWDVHQRKWLKRIAEQMKANTVVDREALDSGRFAESGGFNRLNKLFDGHLDAVLGKLADDVWKEQA
ncbi:MAG: type I restriction-modification system endonuclease [Deltaproteobacteria bacterium]|nr:type I restriction-modification system endonuclease [Deltaproteobacteria bacterium]